MKKISREFFIICKKTKLILLIILLFTLTGCAQTNNYDAENKDNSAVTVDAAPTEVITPAAANPEPSGESEIEPTEKPQYPILDEGLTEALTAYMYESFGGFGDEQFAASWYKYIDYWEIYQNEDFYSGVLHLKERPLDDSARLILSKYYSNDELDILCPILLDVGASLNLDGADLCLIGESLYKIRVSEDAEINYYALAALDIPVYDFLSSGFGRSVEEVKSAIKKNQIPGKDAYACLVDYMSSNYKDAFDGLSMEKVKYMSATVMSNFSDVRIESLDVVDHDSKAIGTYENKN